MNQLLTDMSLERLTVLYESLPDELVRALDGPIGKALNSRPSSVARRPVALRMRALRAFLKRTRDDAVAGEVLRAYLLGPRKALVTTFLDATGVPHDEGQIEGDEEPASEKVAATVAQLVEEHGRDDVILYLEVALRQWPEHEAIEKALQDLRAAT